MSMQRKIRTFLAEMKNGIRGNFFKYYRSFEKYAFIDASCKDHEQYIASITRLYHMIEKGLSYIDYRPGFGKEAIIKLISTMKDYSEKFGTDSETYKTAFSCLWLYIEKNREYGHIDEGIESKVKALEGTPNSLGGIIEFKPLSQEELRCLSFEQLLDNRHSIRHFSKEPVDTELLKKAIGLAQKTPSACNRQGWKSRIITDKTLMKKILANQNGNRGFGEEIDKLVLVTADIRYFQHDREIFQPFIDGGMYAQNILNSLHYYGVASIPLSASLTKKQEKNVRDLCKLEKAEVLILFIGVGNYPDVCQTTRSHRRTIERFDVL